MLPLSVPLSAQDQGQGRTFAIHVPDEKQGTKTNLNGHTVLQQPGMHTVTMQPQTAFRNQQFPDSTDDYRQEIGGRANGTRHPELHTTVYSTTYQQPIGDRDLESVRYKKSPLSFLGCLLAVVCLVAFSILLHLSQRHHHHHH